MVRAAYRLKSHPFAGCAGKLLLFVLVWGFFSPRAVLAIPQLSQGRTEELSQVCSQAIQEVYEKILALKPQYRELKGFDENALQKKEGESSLSYRYNWLEEKGGSPGKGNGYTFQIYLKIVPLLESGPLDNDFFDIVFPKLGLKFYGTVLPRSPSVAVNRELRTQIFAIVRQAAARVYDLERMPSQIKAELVSNKSEYRIGEKITVELILSNPGELPVSVLLPQQAWSEYLAVEDQEGIACRKVMLKERPGREWKESDFRALAPDQPQRYTLRGRIYRKRLAEYKEWQKEKGTLVLDLGEVIFLLGEQGSFNLKFQWQPPANIETIVSQYTINKPWRQTIVSEPALVVIKK